MHRLPSDSVVRKYRLAAVMVVFSFLVIPISFSVLWLGFTFGERKIVVSSVWCMGGSLLYIVITIIFVARLKCPLCMMPPLQRRGCSKNRKSSKFAGSYRLKVALSILGSNQFRCPYCGEQTMMVARKRHH